MRPALLAVAAFRLILREKRDYYVIPDRYVRHATDITQAG
jgi:hypothetical protein